MVRKAVPLPLESTLTGLEAKATERSSEQALVLRDRFASSQNFEITDVAEYDVVLAHLRIPETV